MAIWKRTERWRGLVCLGQRINSNCVVTGNSGSFYAGGVYQGTLQNCTLQNNSASFGGSTMMCTVNNCTLTGNSASVQGGASFGGALNTAS